MEGHKTVLNLLVDEGTEELSAKGIKFREFIVHYPEPQGE